MELTKEFIQSRIEYNPETGMFKWKELVNDKKGWNKRFAGTIINNTNHAGYIRIGIGENHKYIMAHTIAYFLIHNVWCKEIDHENHIRNDNRIINLKESNSKDNKKNLTLRKDSKTGQSGVCFHKNNKKYQAMISVNYKNIHLGSFENIDDAIKARKAAEILHGFHPNHGMKKATAI